MSTNLNEKKKENRAILLGVLLNRTEQEEEELKELLTGKLDWAYLVGALVYHRISGYFYYGLGENLSKFMMPEFKKMQGLLTQAQESCNKARLACLQDTFKRFEEENIHYSTLKGLTYLYTCYPYGIRRSNDCDLLVLESDLKKVDEILVSQGYLQSADGGETEATKKQKLIQIMNYHDLIPYYKKIDAPLENQIKVDINFHIDGKDNDITERVFEYGTKLVERDGFIGRVLDDRTHFIQLCIHYFREGSNTIWVNKKRDLLLYKLVDIENAIRYLGEDVIPRSMEIAKELNVEKQIYYTLFYLNQFYPNKRYEEYMKMFAFDSMDFLTKIHVEGENRDFFRETDLVEETFDMYVTNADYLASKGLL